jgi:hypothetical protein
VWGVSTFKNLNPQDFAIWIMKINDLDAMEDDTQLATKQVYGIDAMLALL